MQNTIETEFRNDARVRFKGPLWEDVNYEQLEPAYAFGAQLAQERRFNETNLHELDDYAQENWPGEYPFNWINMKEAIEFGFALCRSQTEKEPPVRDTQG